MTFLVIVVIVVVVDVIIVVLFIRSTSVQLSKWKYSRIDVLLFDLTKSQI